MLAAVVLVALVVLAGVSAETRAAGAVALGVISVVWLAVNRSMEGQILWTVTPSHGLTAADLAGLAGLLLAAWRLRRAMRRT